MPQKNSIALFSPDAGCTYHWDEFEKKVILEKLKMLKSFFGAEDQERGNAFLYRLLELLRNAQHDKLNLARYAYLLSRMEPKEKQKKERYKKFADAMYGWGTSEKDRGQLITAIYLYVYSERKRV